MFLIHCPIFQISEKLLENLWENKQSNISKEMKILTPAFNNLTVTLPDCAMYRKKGEYMKNIYS